MKRVHDYGLPPPITASHFHAFPHFGPWTLNPGWGSNQEELKQFQDVREIQRVLKARGIPFTLEADEKTSGPAYFQITDPDGNPILVDQHVDKPTR